MSWEPEDTFVDKKGRKIGIDVGDGGAEVYSNGKRVGGFSIEVHELEKTGDVIVEAGVADVDEEFRNAGIGSEMMKRIFETYNRPIVPPPTYDPNPRTRNSITAEGMRLLRSGQRKGWVAEFLDQLPDVD